MSMTLSKTKWFSIIGFALYFGLFLAPKIDPSIGDTLFAFLLTLSLIIVVPSLVFFSIWGVVAFVVSKMRRREVGPRSKIGGIIAITGLFMFVIFLVIANVLPTPLPSGSDKENYSQIIWLDLASANYTEGDITPRQKMLADAIKRLPGKSKAELERMLGPSLDTKYFKNTGRNLIYITGPERDSLFGIDSEWLLIWVDENEMYKRHIITTD